MKQKPFHKILILLLLFFSVGYINGQVTIGSDTPPEKGALLQLKDNTTDSNLLVNAQKGLLLPRVELQDLAKLQMGANSPDLTATAAAEHTGLWVYNTADDGDICPGLYVWDGALWEKLDGACTNLKLTLDKAGPLYFASGLGGSIISPQNVIVTWNPATATLDVTDVNTSFTANPLETDQTGGSTTLKLTPDAMLQTSVDANPFANKASEVKLEVTEDGKTVTKSIIVNQINKALILDTQTKEYPNTITTETNKLTTNANFKVSYLPATIANAISNLKLEGTELAMPGTVTGYEQNDGTGKAGNLTYDVTSNGSKGRYSFVVFSDTEEPKRFLDVSLSVVQCSNSGQQPTIDEWALMAGFTQAEIDAVKETGKDSRILPNGIQMHRIAQTPRGANQIFLSSNFGANPQDSDERWMIHNLDATEYATGVTYTGGDAVAKASGSLTGPMTGTAFNTAYWAYPNGFYHGLKDDDYKLNPRLGLLYTWDAATAGRGGNSGQADLGNEGAIAPTPATRVQGICPAGWHLPNDYEWTDLENQIIVNTSAFSTTTDIGAANKLPYNNTADRGDRHGKAMQEVCQQYGTLNVGTSNTITSALRPGFDAFFAGHAYGSYSDSSDQFANFWSSSTSISAPGLPPGGAWIRGLNLQSSRVYRGSTFRSYMLSVRCKKD